MSHVDVYDSISFYIHGFYSESRAETQALPLPELNLRPEPIGIPPCHREVCGSRAIFCDKWRYDGEIQPKQLCNSRDFFPSQTQQLSSLLCRVLPGPGYPPKLALGCLACRATLISGQGPRLQRWRGGCTFIHMRDANPPQFDERVPQGAEITSP